MHLQPLWFPAPAHHWNEALPVGNGTLGAMVFGHPYEERIALNHDRLWAGSPRDRVNPQALATLPQVRQAIFAGEVERALQLTKDGLLGDPPCIESYEPLGDLRISCFTYQGAVTNYRREVDLEGGRVVVRMTRGDVPCEQRVFVSAVDQVLVCDLRSFHPDRTPYALRLRLDRSTNATQTFVGTDLLLTGATDAGLPFCARVRVLGARCMVSGGILHPEWVKDLTILLAAEVGPGCQEAVLARLEAAEALGVDALAARHAADWIARYGRLSVEFAGPDRSHLSLPQRLAELDAGVADPALIACAGIQYRRYLQLCSSRPGSLPSTLQGIWNQDLRAVWNSDLHTNINLQMNYWPQERANLAETVEPLMDWLEGIIPSGEDTARRMYGCRGWVLHHLSDRWGTTTPCDGPHGLWPMGGAWMAQHAWWHYAWSGDLGFLAGRGWRILSGAARFLLDFLVEAPAGTRFQGLLVTNPSHSPENRFRLPDGRTTDLTCLATMDLGIIRDCLANTIAAAEALQDHHDFADECRRTLARLPGYQISARYGGLQEWIEDHEEVEPGHRHLSHLFGLFPGNSITGAELTAAARRSLERRLSHQQGADQETGWSLGWQSCLWARLGDGDRALACVRAVLGHRSMPNLMTDAHGFPQVGDAHGITMGLLECLVQDHDGVVELLPALPTGLPTGRITGLRLRGGHTLDLAWQDGRLTLANLHPAAPGTLVIGWQGMRYQTMLAPGGLIALAEHLCPGARRA